MSFINKINNIPKQITVVLESLIATKQLITKSVQTYGWVIGAVDDI